MSVKDRVRLTPLQRVALLAVWPRLLQQPPPNCSQLVVAAADWFLSYQSLIACLDRLAKKGVLRWWKKGNARLWAPGPLSDYLQEQGVLPS
jgi:predicted transcriptional regulator